MANLKNFFKVVSNAEAEDHRRQLALEVIVALSETAPAMVRKNWKYIPNLGKFFFFFFFFFLPQLLC